MTTTSLKSCLYALTQRRADLTTGELCDIMETINESIEQIEALESEVSQCHAAFAGITQQLNDDFNLGEVRRLANLWLYR